MTNTDFKIVSDEVKLAGLVIVLLVITIIMGAWIINI